MLSVLTRVFNSSDDFRYARWIFPFLLFLSASLLFALQPMVGKRLLPFFGGTPAVWTVCMLFFQSMLLLGYAYAWCLSRLKGTIAWRVIHGVVSLISLYFLPLHLTPVLEASDPALQILLTLLPQLGLPVLVISSSAPLLQYAFSQTDAKKSRDPYFLYVASNIGSLLALLSYPWIIERVIGVSDQFRGWDILYVTYIILVAVLLLTSRLRPIATHQPVAIGWKCVFLWIGLSFIPCSLMLGVTLYITTDIASTPLFWVVPLALYLLTFIISFAETPLIKSIWIMRSLPMVILLMLLSFIFGAAPVTPWVTIGINLIGFFMAALLCHTKLVTIRPPAQQLTLYYLCIALGGVFAGVFNGLIAPRIFTHAYEYPLVMLLAIVCLLPPRRWIMTFATAGALIAWFTTHHSEWMQAFHMADTISQQRNFYGIKRVFFQNKAHYFMSQSTLHGFQLQTSSESTNGEIAYYGPIAPIINRMQQQTPSLRATILGLGAGTLLCQFQKNATVNLIEIDEQVIQMASNPDLFTNLRDCPAEHHVIQADGRLAMTKFPDVSTDLLILDAFSSDAIPVHLLTLEAFSLYQKKIAPGGVVLINISNRHIHVLPVITAIADKLDLILLFKASAGDTRLGQFPSQWAILTANQSLAMQLIQTEHWQFVTEKMAMLWTDDYSNIIPFLV